VVEPAGDREDAEAEGVRAGRTVVLHHADGAAEQLERIGDLGGAARRIHGAAEHGLDLLLRILDAGVLVGFERRFDDHVLRRLVPVLAELAAAHADDGDFVADSVWIHPYLRLTGGLGRTHISDSYLTP